MSVMSPTLLVQPRFSGEARAIFARMTPQASTAKQTINSFILGAKAIGFWYVLDVFVVLAATDAQSALINWAHPEVVPTVSGTATFTAAKGFAGDGSTGFINSNINLSTFGGRASLDSFSLFCWTLTDLTSDTAVDIGTGNSAQIYSRRTTAGSMLTRNGGTTSSTVAVADSLGLSMATRGSSSSYDRYRNSTDLTPAAVASAALNNSTLRGLCGGQGQGFSTRQQALFGAGAHVPASMQPAAYALMQTLLQNLGAI